jgi:hypothetical protein
MFCPQCGKEARGLNFCDSCGAQVNPSGYNPQAANASARGFIDIFTNQAGSLLFLIGIALFTAGNLLSIFLSFNTYNIIMLLFLALPILGFWLIFASSKVPQLSEQIPTALTLFKVSAIIDLVILCLAGLLLVIMGLLLFVAAAALGSGGVFFAGVFLIGIAVVVVAIAVVYFKLTMGVLGGIRENIERNTLTPIPKIEMFSIITYIFTGFSALVALITMVAVAWLENFVDSFIRELPREIRNMVMDFLPDTSGVSLSSFFTLVACAGVVACIIALNEMNKKMVP